MLKYFSGYFHSIIVFSPTVASDATWDWVKEQKLLIDNKPLKDWVKSLKRKEKENNESVVERKDNAHEIEEVIDLGPLEDKRIPEENFFSEYNEDTLREIMDEQMKLVRILKDHGKSKHLANR